MFYYYIFLIFLRLFLDSIIRTLLRESFTKTHKRTHRLRHPSRNLYFFLLLFFRVRVSNKSLRDTNNNRNDENSTCVSLSNRIRFVAARRH